MKVGSRQVLSDAQHETLNLSFPRRRESITLHPVAHRMDSRLRGNDGRGGVNFLIFAVKL
jgi:hypothetical protein